MRTKSIHISEIGHEFNAVIDNFTKTNNDKNKILLHSHSCKFLNNDNNLTKGFFQNSENKKGLSSNNKNLEDVFKWIRTKSDDYSFSNNSPEIIKPNIKI